MIQVRLKIPVHRIRTNNSTEFVKQTLREYYEMVGISHKTSVARSPQQNGVVERRNRTLIKVAYTMTRVEGLCWGRWWRASRSRGKWWNGRRSGEKGCGSLAGYGVNRSIRIDIPIRLRLTLVKRIQFHLRHYGCPSPAVHAVEIEKIDTVNQQQQPEFPSLDLGITVQVFKQGDDLIDSINHIMSFLSAVVTSRYPTTNNQLLNLSNPRQQATFNDGKITLQPVQGRQISFASDTSRTYTSEGSRSNSEKQRIVICYNCKREGHMSKQCTKPKRKRDDSWFKDKVLLAAVQNSNSSAQQDALILYVIEQLKTQVVNCTKINLDNKSVNDTLTTELERYKKQVKVSKEGQNVALKSKDNVSDSCAQSIEIDHLKQTLSEHLKKESLIDQPAQTIHMLTKPQFFYDLTTKQALGFQNPFYLKNAQHLEPKLYDGNAIEKTSAIVIPDSEETLMLAEESRLKMLLKQKDPMIPTNVEVPKELPKVSMVNTCLKKLKHHLVGYDVEKVLVITALKDDLRKLKGKALADNVVTSHSIALEMLNVHMEPLAPKLLNNRTVHSDYLRYTHEQAVILREELLLIIRQTCPCINNLSDKLVVVTPMDKTKRVRFTDPVTSLGNINTKTASSSNLVSNKPVLSFTGVKLSTKASGSQPSDNAKKDKIQQPSSSTQKSKVEAHPRIIKSSLKNKNRTVEPKGTASVQHPSLMQILNFYVLSVMGRKVWKPTGKVFTNIIYTWRPTGQTFTIVGNVCPLTRITTTTEVPSRKPIALEIDTPKPVVTFVYSRKPRKSKTTDPVSKSKVVQIVLWYLDSDCYKHMTRDRSQPTNFVNKFLGTIKFQNDHVAKITSYGDYQMRNVTISRVYYVEGLGHNLFSVGQLCDSNLEVAFCQHTCFIHNQEGVDLLTGSRENNLYTLSLGDIMATDNGIKFVNQTLREYFEKVGISHETSVARSLQINGVVERRNRTLIEVAHTMLIYAKASLFLWAKAVATACYNYNRSIVRLRHDKTTYELLHDKLPDLSFFHVFDALCYPTNDSENVDFDELTAMASEHSSSGPTLHEMTPATNLFKTRAKHSSFNTVYTTVDHPAPEVIAPIAKLVAPEPVASTGLPSSTTFNQDAPSPSNSQTTPETQFPIIPNDVEEDNYDLDVAHMNNDMFFDIPILEVLFDKSSSTNFIHTTVHLDHQIFEHNNKWTKDHLLENIIGELAKPQCKKSSMSLNAFEYGSSLEAIRTFLAFAAHMNMVVYQMDVKTAFLNGSVDPTMFIHREGKALLLISQSPRGIFINQSKYVLESLNKYGFDACNQVDTPMVEKSKLDEDKEGKVVDSSHYHGMIGTLLYLTANADHAGCQDTHRSTSGSMQFMGDRLIPMYNDNKSAIALCCNNVQHSKSKHIDIRYHFIKEKVKNRVIELYFVNTEYQLANIFTKAFGRERIEFFINKLGMQSFMWETLKQLADEVEE
nr:retrovirus-related Pol polyprotein from transposon TNT 1-94 [Tanacetum cinerariifolium]